MPGPRLRSYQPETVIAEKVHAIVFLGSKNSRMRDFFDLYELSRRRAFEGHALSRAVRATFARRRTSIPNAIPFGFTAEFAESKEKTLQWAGFLQKNRLTALEFPAVVAAVNQFLVPVLDALSSDRPFAANWPPEGPWA